MVEGLGHAFWMRNYRAGLAKWQAADPMGCPDGWNQLAYCGNGVTSGLDLCGGWCESVHHDINETYLDRQGINRHEYHWGARSLDVLSGLNAGSDWTDSIGAGNQSDDKAYLHAMSSENQGLLGAMSSWNSYLKQVEKEAKELSDCARACYSLGWYTEAYEYENRAIMELGKLFHTFDDSFSPSHSGFQHFSMWSSLSHMLKETMSVYLTGVYGNTTYRTGGYRDYIYGQIVSVYNATVWYVLRQPE